MGCCSSADNVADDKDSDYGEFEVVSQYDGYSPQRGGEGAHGSGGGGEEEQDTEAAAGGSGGVPPSRPRRNSSALSRHRGGPMAADDDAMDGAQMTPPVTGLPRTNSLNWGKLYTPAGGDYDEYDDDEVSRDPRLCSPSESSLFGAPSSLASGASFLLTGNANSRSNVTADTVRSYVSQMGRRDSIFGSSHDGSSVGLNGSEHMSDGMAFVAQLKACNTIAELDLLEACRRSELYANFTVTNKMILLAARRVVPVMRRKTGKPAASKTNRKHHAKAVIVVHHRDLSHIAEGGDGGSHIDPMNSSSGNYTRNTKQHSQRASPAPEGADFSIFRFDGVDEGGGCAGGDVASSNGNSPSNPEGSGGVVGPIRRSSRLLRRVSSVQLLNPGENRPEHPVSAADPPAPGTTGALLHKGVCAKPVFSMEGYDAMRIECNAKKFKPKTRTYYGPSWDIFSEPDATEELNKGNVLFKFRCTTIKNMTEEDKDLMQPLINTSGFADEQVENNVPIIDFNNKDIGLWTLIVVKTCYMLPGHKFENLSPSVLGSQEYHMECEPGPPKVAADDPERPNTSRCTFTLIKFVFSVTLMLKVHELGPEYCEKLEFIDGIVPAKILLQERTRRDVSKEDGTVTVKSLLMYYPVTGGVLCSNLTFVLNRTVPRVAAPLVNGFGGQGAKDGAITAEKTRTFLLKKFGDSRKELE